jgi:hypothetical protein
MKQLIKLSDGNSIELLSVMKKGFLALTVFILAVAHNHVLAQNLPLTPNLINLNSQEGERLLMESQVRQDYLPLTIHFTPQQNGAYCGVASSVMVLNALSVPAPKAPEYGSFRFFTQNNFFNDETNPIITAELVSKQGLTLEQFSELLKTHGAKVQVFHADETSLAAFRTLAIKNLSDSDNFFVVNYLRRALQQKMGGHFSPLGAYHEGTDRFLILDVSPYLYPPVWVTAEELWQAMDTTDSVVDAKRGFVIVSHD